MLPLNANRFRYAHENASKILCSFCETEIEDEVTGHAAVCDYILQRESLRKGRVGGWGCWGGGWG